MAAADAADAGRAEDVVGELVAARPDDLDRAPQGLGQGDGLGDDLGFAAAAEPA